LSETAVFYLRLALTLAVIWSSLRYGFNFPENQAIALTFAFAWIFWAIGELIGIQKFKPYRVGIELNIPIILIELGLIADVSDWLPQRESAKTNGLEYESFNFYAIQPQLFARSDRIRYSRVIEIKGEIDSVELPALPESETSRIWQRGPRFYFVPIRGIYELGLVLPDNWAERAKELFAHARVEKKWIPGAGEGLCVELARVPASYIHDHVLRYYEPVTLFKPYTWWKKRDDRWGQRLASMGWKRFGESPDYISHKYLSISVSEV
jgi:hypothetical protein